MVYIAESENVVADVLSWIYSNDSPEMVRAPSEFTCHDVLDDDTLLVMDDIGELPVLAGVEAVVATRRSSRVHIPTAKAAAAQDMSTADEDRSFVRRTPAKRKEGGNTEYNNPGMDLPDVPSVPDSPAPQATTEPALKID